MNRHEKLLLKILRGKADADIPFEALCNLLAYLGFEERVSGGHHIFRRADVEERINLQRDGKTAKVYQVRQVRTIILRHNLAGDN